MRLIREACCGLREIDGLSLDSNARQAMESFITNTLVGGFYEGPDHRWRYAVFTEASNALTRHFYGLEFARFIRTHKLGKLVTTSGARNPNSHKHLRAWLWEVDWNAIKKYAKKSKKSQASSL